MARIPTRNRKPRQLDVRSSYLDPVFDPRKLALVVRRLALEIKRVPGGIDTIAVRGVSGMLVGAPLAYATGKPILVVRKDDGSHSSNRVEGPTFAGTYVIIDDLVDSGDTLREIVVRVKDHDPAARCASVMLYAHYTSITCASSRPRALERVREALDDDRAHIVIMHADAMCRIATRKLESQARARQRDRELAHECRKAIENPSDFYRFVQQDTLLRSAADAKDCVARYTRLRTPAETAAKAEGCTAPPPVTLERGLDELEDHANAV